MMVVSDVQSYDPVIDALVQRDPSRIPRAYFGADVIDGTLYAVAAAPTTASSLPSRPSPPRRCP